MGRSFGKLPGMACACLLAAAAIFPLSAVIGSDSLAAEGGLLTVQLGPTQTIREVAQEYLGDPDLWPEILRASGLDSIADVSPGSELKIPANEVSAANKALVDAVGQIRSANLAGAQIFAPDHIGRAIDLYNEALNLRLQRQWQPTLSRATASHAEATTALEISKQQRNQAAEALLADRQGNVEGLRSQDLLWRALLLKAVLIEQEKVRTLSNSTAQIRFRDASKLRLNANSTAVIQQMRVDPLSRTEGAKVSLVEGDFYALLSGESTRKSFDVQVPDVNATIDSGNFWVSHDASGAKFTNYDDRAVKIVAQGETVTLGRNEGSVVRPGEKPKEKVAVLPSTALSAPANNQTIYHTPFRLEWAAAPEAAGYWLELASDQSFDHMVISRFGLDRPSFAVERLEAGTYHWRVAVLDQFGLPGERSAAWRFEIAIDETPPYLTIEAPAPGRILRDSSVTLTGTSEQGASVTVNGTPVTLEGDGRYSASVALTAGKNRIVVAATDAAGNTTTKDREVVSMPDQRSLVRFDSTIPSIGPNHFLTSESVISLSGEAIADATIEARTESGEVRSSTIADSRGRFRINIPLLADEESIAFAVIAPSGYTTAEPISVTIDRAAPEVTLADTLPRLTADATLVLRGQTERDAKLAINGHEVPTDEGRFTETVTLRLGENTIELIATDTVGNVHLERWVVVLDQAAPKLVRSRIVRDAAHRKTLSIEIVADDPSGLANAAPFSVKAGSNLYTGYLRYNRATKTYEGTLVVPEAQAAQAILRDVELEDNAGNKQTYSLN